MSEIYDGQTTRCDSFFLGNRRDLMAHCPSVSLDFIISTDCRGHPVAPNTNPISTDNRLSPRISRRVASLRLISWISKYVELI